MYDGFDISLLNKLRHIKARLSSLPSLFLTCYFDSALGKFTQFECFAKVDDCCAVVSGEALVKQFRINNYQRFASDFSFSFFFSTCIPSSAPRIQGINAGTVSKKKRLKLLSFLMFSPTCIFGFLSDPGASL